MLTPANKFVCNFALNHIMHKIQPKVVLQVAPAYLLLIQLELVSPIALNLILLNGMFTNAFLHVILSLLNCKAEYV